jgi:chloramphenicol 3-O-phosphotransferase
MAEALMNMNNNARYVPPGVLFINGATGSGKTTIARMIARESPKGAHIDGDEIHNLIVGGRLHPPEKPEEEVERQLELRFRNMALLADSFFQSGVFPVLETCISTREYLDYLISRIKARPVAMVILAPPVGVMLERDSKRPEKNVAHLHTDRYEEIYRELGTMGLWIDNGDMTPEQTKIEIIRRAFSEGIIRR